MKRFFLFLFILLFSLQQIAILPGCANIIPPQGGPRDSIPPRLIKASPADSSRNFTGNRIVFSFDEFIDLQDAQGNLLVSPTPKIPPEVTPKLNTVTVKLKDALEPNTTYSLNFGNAIKDVDEGNVLKGFTYIFSTGRYIDSLELHGKVILAETGKTDSTLIVMLHTSGDDSAILKERPRYIARLDGQGNFTFKNLPPATFYLYALKDESGMHLYSNTHLFAFADKPVVISSKTEMVTLYAYTGKENQQEILPALNLGSRNKTGGNPAEKRLRYQTNLINNEQDLLSGFFMTFDQPLRSYDSSKVHLYTDTSFIPVTFRFVKDSSNRKLQLIQEWKENTIYHLIMEKDFAEDSSGKKLLKPDTLSFRTKKLTDYGSLKIRFRDLDLSKNPVLYFVINESIVKSFPLSSIDFSQSLFLPGDYELRILYDDNKNGKWDPGQFFGRHRQPEIVKPVQRRIAVKPGTENEFEIAL